MSNIAEVSTDVKTIVGEPLEYPSSPNPVISSSILTIAPEALLSTLCLPADTQSSQLIAALDVPKHVLASALPNHTTNYDPTGVATACHVPIAYIFSIMPFLDLAHFQRLTPQLVSARTLGSGHFSPVEIPAQINAMIARFLKVQ